MQGVTISKAVRQNLQAMQSTAKMMAETQNHLATGKKVNSALDNPTNFFTASALDSRAGDLGNLMDSVGNAVQTLQAADNGIKAITKLVESAQGTARQALQADKGASNNDQVKGSLTGSMVDTVYDAGSAKLAANDTMAFTVGSASAVTVTFASGDVDTLEHVAAKIDSVDGLSASIDSAGKIAITAAADGEQVTVTDGTSGGATKLGFSTGTASTNGAVETFGDSTTRANLETEYKELMDQVDQLTKDAGFNGNNFLNGDKLKVTFNEDATSTLTIKGADTSASGLGLSDPASKDFQDNTKIEAVLGKLDSAMESLRSTSSTFGSNLSVVQTRQDFTENMINTLQEGAANLTMADLNEEGANMLALQTRQSLATTAMSMASRADQSVLSLLR